MLKNVRFVFKYIHYRFTAQTKHGIHSPFVFKLLTTVINNATPHQLYAAIENLRATLLKSTKKINVTDYGTAGATALIKVRAVAEIVKHAAKPPKYAQLLFRLVTYFRPAQILELGTSLGITTLYQAMPYPHTNVLTIEGCPETAALARQHFQTLNANNVNLLVGSFEQLLPTALQQMPSLDFVFFDGNHRKAATINYFEQCLQYIHNDTVFVFDDIHWSAGMEEAWEYIKNSPQVTVTLDLFFLGIVFFRKEQAKQDFIIKF